MFTARPNHTLAIYSSRSRRHGSVTHSAYFSSREDRAEPARRRTRTFRRQQAAGPTSSSDQAADNGTIAPSSDGSSRSQISRGTIVSSSATSSQPVASSKHESQALAHSASHELRGKSEGAVSTNNDEAKQLQGYKNLTLQQLTDHLDLSSPVDVFRRYLLGPDTLIRSRILNDRMLKAQTDTPHQRLGNRNRTAQPSLEEWFMKRRPTHGSRRVRLIEDETETRNPSEGTYVRNELEDDDRDPFHQTDLQPDLNRYSELHDEEHHHEHERVSSTLIADSVRFQIRACRSPEDIRRTVTNCLRPIPNPNHPKHKSSAFASDTPHPRATTSEPLFLTNPAAYYVSSPHVQYAIASILSRQPIDKDYNIISEEEHARALRNPLSRLHRSTRTPFEPRRILICINTIMHRFRAHDPPLVIEVPIIEVGLLSAAQDQNYSALRLWLSVWRQWEKTRAAKSDGKQYLRMRSQLFTRVLHRLQEAVYSSRLTEKTSQDIPYDGTLPTPPTLQERDAGALRIILRELRHFVQSTDCDALREYILLLGACGPAARDPLLEYWSQFEAQRRRSRRSSTLTKSNKHVEDPALSETDFTAQEQGEHIPEAEKTHEDLDEVDFEESIGASYATARDVSVETKDSSKVAASNTTAEEIAASSHDNAITQRPVSDFNIQTSKEESSTSQATDPISQPVQRSPAPQPTSSNLLIPVHIVHLLFHHQHPKDAWSIFRKIAFSRLYGPPVQHSRYDGKSHPADTPRSQSSRARRQLFRLAFSQIEHGRGMPHLHLNVSQKRLLEQEMGALLEERLRVLEDALGVKWNVDATSPFRGSHEALEGRAMMSRLAALASGEDRKSGGDSGESVEDAAKSGSEQRIEAQDGSEDVGIAMNEKSQDDADEDISTGTFNRTTTCVMGQ
ncbi:MAG: hypothetical protein Q9159_003690 [Coniocarpon cinnabarinum]